MVNNSADCIMGLTQNNFSNAIVQKLNYITSIDEAFFSIDNSKLMFTPQEGRLLSPDEIVALEDVIGGMYINYIDRVDPAVFDVVKGELFLTQVSPEALTGTVGDLSKLLTYADNPDTTIVDEINNLYTIVSWQDIKD